MLATNPKIENLRTFEVGQGAQKRRVMLCKRGAHYGVVTLFENTAVAADYHNPSRDQLSTVVGNEAAIIDWVDIRTAERRYAELFASVMNHDEQGALDTPVERPRLSVVK